MSDVDVSPFPFATPTAAPTGLALDGYAPRLQWLLFGCGVIAAAFALLWALDDSLAVAAQRGVLCGNAALLAGVFALTGWAARRGRERRAAHTALWATLAAVGATTLALGHGLHAVPLGALSLLVCMACVMVGRGPAFALAAASAGLLLALAVLQGGAPPGDSVVGALLGQLLLVAAGLVSGAMAGLSMRPALHAARERERHFAGLLGIAADWYWEQDAELRFTRSEGKAATMAAVDCLGKRRWEVEGLQLTPEEWQAHRADLQARRPFRDLVIRLPDVSGLPRWASVSGEPTFDARGRFTGYWGVGHEVTSAVLAQQARRQSENRYRELFTRSPSPMLMHRRGIVMDANEAARALFGHASIASMMGEDIVGRFPEGSARERAQQRLARAEQLAVGEQLPQVEMTLQRCDGQTFEAQLTCLRVELDDGPATLSICIDTTQRVAAERALRESHVLLQRLVDTSPDVCALTELISGRLIMVNERFTRVLGWTAEEALGRTSLDLGLWAQRQGRRQMRLRLAEHGVARESAVVLQAKSGALVRLSLAMARFEHGGRDYVVASAREIEAAEQARLEHEAILAHASVGIAFTRKRRFVQVNAEFERMFGWGEPSLVGESGSVVWASEEQYAEIGAAAGPLLAAGRPFELECQMRRRDGSSFWCHLGARVVDPGDPSRGGTIWIAQDVTERRQTEQALATARDAAEAASRAKSAFLANMSHEIRTPLNGLLGLARLAREPGQEPLRHQQYLVQMEDSAQSLASIISDILDVSKIEAGKIELEAVPFDLTELLQSTLHAWRALAEARGLLLWLRIEPDVPRYVRGDPVRVRQILSNYLSNAIKFTSRGEVAMRASRAAGDGRAQRLVFSVSDSGCGIDAAVQARLFQPFTQADESTTRRYGGTGLGLSICRELAALMGGEVGVASEPGRGARFWAELPLPAVQDAAPARADDATPPAARLAGARVLLVEDNAVNMMIAAAMLERWGVHVVQASDGQQALDAVAAASASDSFFDVVLMDVQMPVMSGHEAARRLRERWSSAALPIVALTAAALTSERDQAMAAGMDAFLTKPIDAEHLHRTLARVLQAKA